LHARSFFALVWDAAKRFRGYNDMESIGDLLREARHSKKATLEDVSRITKITIDILEKLEAGAFDKLAAPAYTKGFLKLYAEYLGLDSQAIVEAYLSSQGGLRREGLQVQTEVAAERRRRTQELQLPMRGIVFVVAAVTVIAFGLWLGKNLRKARTERPATPAPVAKVTSPVPKADFEAYYQPKSPPQLLEPPSTR
jgi:cytoskeletal protein RodZ